MQECNQTDFSLQQKQISCPPLDAFAADFSWLRRELPQEYGRFQQHLSILEDRRRLEAFSASISVARKGRIVVDIGSGTGILAFLALKAGFEHAWLVEPSHKLLYYSQYLATVNKIAERCRFVSATAEIAVTKNLIPDIIDLVISETISSVIVGFGSWDVISQLEERITSGGTMIPANGRLFARLVNYDYSSRPESSGGLKFLRDQGIAVDLYRRTFRSGGNVYPKWKACEEIRSGTGPLVDLLRFEYRRKPPIEYVAQPVSWTGRLTTRFIGMLLFWTVGLSETEGITLSSHEPELLSWCPYYIPFSRPICCRPGEKITLTMRLLPIDAPVLYAFQFCNSGKPITEVLYW